MDSPEEPDWKPVKPKDVPISTRASCLQEVHTNDGNTINSGFRAKFSQEETDQIHLNMFTVKSSELQHFDSGSLYFLFGFLFLYFWGPVLE